MFILAISENILVFGSAFGIIQAFVLACMLFFSKKSDRSVTKYMALFIIAITVPMWMAVVPHFFSWQVIIFLEPFTLLGGPFIYLYIRSFKEVISWKKALPHLALFFLFIPLAFIVYQQIGLKYPAGEIVPPEVTKHPLSFIPVSIRLLQRVVYFFLARKALISYQRSIQHLFSETSRISLGWGKWLVNGYLLVVISIIIMYSLMVKYPDQFNLWLVSNGIIVTVYVYMATIRAMTQPTIWQLKPELTKEKVEEAMNEAESLENEIADKAGPGKFDGLVHRITGMMEQEKLYQESELTLQDLADKLAIPSYQVSQAINEGMKKNFYDLINGYRVEEAKRLLLDSKNKNYTILSVGFEAGFNSKTTFNTVFKKFTGLTPTDFRTKQLAGPAMVEA